MSAVIAETPHFSWQEPDYLPIFARRVALLRKLRSTPGALSACKIFYRSNPGQFISDWGTVLDPWLIERGLPGKIPFLLFPKQIECVNWIMERWRAGEPGLIEKSRDSGISSLTMLLAATLCLFHENLVVGVGSRKEVLVDSYGDSKSLLYKVRLFLENLPAEFLGGWDVSKHSPSMRIIFPATGSSIVGESGENIGRGGRCSLFILDEAAFVENPEVIDASLASVTNTRIDVSTPNGFSNSFARRRHGGKIKVFTIAWRDDPRKGEKWFEKQQRDLDPVDLAREVMIDYGASINNILIPRAWVEAAINAHVRLGITPSGTRRAALDVADLGRDLNAFAGRHGILLE